MVIGTQGYLCFRVCVTTGIVRVVAMSVQPVVPSWLNSLQPVGMWEGTCLLQLLMQRWGSNSLLFQKTCTHTHTSTMRSQFEC